MYNLILKNDEFKTRLKIIEEAEKERVYCKHEIHHFLEVARIGMILNLEENLGLSKELVYSAALLHDLGRSEEYKNGTPHDEAGVSIAEGILKECGASTNETEAILFAIHGHRGLDEVTSAGNSVKEKLAFVIKKADHFSRDCFNCKAIDTCKWPDEKKNLKINY